MTYAKPDELASLLRQEGAACLRIAAALLSGDRAAAEDVVQKACLKAFEQWSRGRDGSRGAWFRQIVVNAARDHLRRQRTIGRLGEWLGALRSTSAPSPRDPLLPERLGRALSQLTEAQREAFVLIHLYGHTVGEAAGLIGRAEGTVKSHLHRALEKLRAELADYGGTELDGTRREVG